MFGNNCVKNCPLGNYACAETKKCLQCSSNCKSCFGGKEHQCLECFYGYELDHTECVQDCPVNRYQDSEGHCDWCH